MHWVNYDGYRFPKQIAGHPALEFCNTRANWGHAMIPGAEWLDDFDTFAVWCQYVALIDDVTGLRATAAADPDTAQRELAHARTFRQALYTLLTSDGDAESLEIVNRGAQRAAGRAHLARRDRGAYAWNLVADDVVTAANDVVAQSAVRLLCAPELTIVRSCPGDECGWLFLDKRGRRRWCAMESCGNRAKVRAFAARQRSR